MRYVPQNKEVYLDLNFYKQGLLQRVDQSFTPLGSFRKMSNTQITDRGGIGPRRGTKLIGSEHVGSGRNHGFYNFKRSFNADELLVKNVGTQTLAYSKLNPSLGWFVIRDGNRDDEEWGYTSSLVNDDDTDLLIGGNRYDEMISWSGNYCTLRNDITTNDTTIDVDSVLEEESYEQNTADGTSTTTAISVANTPDWADDQWIGMYVYITSGASVGEVRKITDSTSSVLTTEAFTSVPDGTFEIRRLKIDPTGKVKVGSFEYQISAINRFDQIDLVVGVTEDLTAGIVIPDAFRSYAGSPRGNRFTNWLTRTIVGNVRSAKATNSGGTEQGYASGGSAFVSKILDPVDFSYTIPRTVGDGDIVSAPYGGGDITDVKHFENNVYMFKPDYIEAFNYTQDGTDLVVREPLKEGVGSIGKVIEGTDDIYFITNDKKFTSIGRAYNKDLKPQTANLGYNIKTLLDKLDFSDVTGWEHKDKIYISCKSEKEPTYNDITLVYNKQYDSFEGIWDIGFFGFAEWDGLLVGAESATGDVVQLLTGVEDKGIKISCEAQSHFFNLVSTKNNEQAVSGLYFEGYVDDFSDITIQLYKDNEPNPVIEFTFDVTDSESGDEDFTNTIVSGAYLGQDPLGTQPLGAVNFDYDAEGQRRFYFRVYFPFIYGRYFALDWLSSGKSEYEFINVGLLLKEEYNTNTKTIKSVV